MKIAIISDVHGNPSAFNAVLKDIKDKNCDMLLSLGDIAMAGYDPNSVIEKFRMLTHPKSPIPTKMILGNTDLMVMYYSEDGFEKILKVAPCMAYALQDDMKIINEDNIEFLKTLPKNLLLELDGMKVFMCHGSPRKIDESIRPETSPSELEEMVKDVQADLIVCGHTHVPCGFQLESGKTVMNVGSVGRPMTIDKSATYAILETSPDSPEYSIVHQSVQYDNLAVADRIRKRGYKECETIAKMFEE